jgi:uncharacterized protein YuzE
MKILSFIGLPTALQHGDEILVDRTGNGNVSCLRVLRNSRHLSISAGHGLIKESMGEIHLA